MSFTVIPFRAVEDDTAASAATSAASIFAVEFDGVNDYVVITSGNVTAQATIATSLLLSYWWQYKSGSVTPTNHPTLWSSPNTNSGALFSAASTPLIEQIITLGNDSGVTKYRHDTNAHVSADVWHHTLNSINYSAAASAGSGDYQYYLDDAVIGAFLTLPTSADAGTVFDIHGTWRIGADKNNLNLFNGKLCNFAVYATAPDLTVTANRRKFITSGGAPVALGVSGEAPGLGAPLYYFNGGVSAWHVNKGVVRDVATQLNGALVSASPPTSAGGA